MNAHRTDRLSLALLLISALACAQATDHDSVAPSDSSQRLVGIWRAVLLSPGGDLPFTLEISKAAEGLRAVAINGEERVPFSDVELSGDNVTLAFDWYDSRIEARLAGDGTMSGQWQKTVPGGVSSLDFLATQGAAPRFLPMLGEERPTGVTDVTGTWQVEFSDDDGTQMALGEFHQQGSHLVGTFLTPTGDYRFLEGSFEAGQLRLSTFDGAHAFLFQARATEDASLVGNFWSRDSYHATWTAKRIDEDETILPDAWSQASLTNDEGRFRFAFDDIEGARLASDDARFAGKVVIVNIFGSWCPNCNDEEPLLVEWYRRYRDRGLEIVGLAYEFSGDIERDRLYVRKFADRHGVEFPLLLAGISDKQAAAETLPDLTAVIAFPTSVFIGRDGRVRRIHTGFTGPGTGSHYTELVIELEALIEELLAESA